MQNLRPYVLPGLFVFHLVVLCVMLATVSGENEFSGGTAIVTVVSQFFLTALFAGLGSGSWSLRIPSWGALAVLSWISLVFFLVHLVGPPPGNAVWQIPLVALVAWIVLVTLLLCLRGIQFFELAIRVGANVGRPTVKPATAGLADTWHLGCRSSVGWCLDVTERQLALVRAGNRSQQII